MGGVPHAILGSMGYPHAILGSMGFLGSMGRVLGTAPPQTDAEQPMLPKMSGAPKWDPGVPPVLSVIIVLKTNYDPPMLPMRDTW